MAETISGMPDAGPLTGDELFEVSQDSSGTLVSRKAALSVIATYLGGVGPQNNFDGTADPTATNNAAEGYSVGSQWFNVSSGEIFKLIRFDGTDAVWVKTTLTLDELGSAATAAVTDFLQVANNGSDIADPAAFRAALALGAAATRDVGLGPNQLPTTSEADARYAQRANLLVNGDFSVNQRRFAGGNLAAGEFGYDRWGTPSGGAGADVSVSNGVVTLASGALVQVIESPDLAGEELNVSVEDPTADITVEVEGVVGTITAGSGRRGTTIAVPGASTGDVTVKLSSASTVSFSRVKAERGDFPTAWAPRLIAEEMAICQRYFLILGDQRGISASYSAVDLGIMRTASDARFVFRMGVPMRTTPVIGISDLSNIRLEAVGAGGMATPPSNFAVFNDGPISFVLAIIFDSATSIVAGSSVVLQAISGGFLFADAELPI